MKKTTTSLLALLTFFCAILLPKQSFATHAAGGEIIYEWVSGSTYTIYFKFYRACGPGATSTEPTTQTVCYYNSCNSSTGSVVLNKTLTLPGGAPNGTEVGTYCPTDSSYCKGGTLPGYREWWYSNTVTLPSQCDHWTFFTGVGSRNNSINNLTNPGGQTLYIEATLNNLYAQGNSSPYFTVKPTPFVCVNSPYTYNNGAIDPNNDSLSYESIAPRTGPTGCTFPPNPTNIPYNNVAFNVTNNPFSTNNTYSVNASTGQISFTPALSGTSVVTILVKEWRNGVLIGTVIRDIQIIILACSGAQPSLATIQSSITGAQMNNGQVEGCAGQFMSFCADIKTSSPSSILVVTDNHAVATVGSSISYTGLLTDSVRACFSWTPGFLDTGLHVLSFTVKDSNCSPATGIILSQTFSIPIYVWPVTNIFNDTTICPGDSVHLVAVGGSSFTWTVLPGGSPLSTLSCTNCKTPTATPMVTTKYVVTSNNLSICNKNKDTVTITVPTPPVINAGPDTTTCINNSLQLNINLTQVPGTTYDVVWSPSTYLNNSTIGNPVTSPTNDITYYITVTPNGLSRCAAKDTLTVKVLQGIKLFNGDTAICLGNTININTFGDIRYNYSWTPTIGVSSTTIQNPTITPDTTHTYILTAKFPGCRDSIQKFKVEVEPVPVVYIGADQTLCYGDTLHLDNVSITPALFPNYNYSWSPAGFFTPTSTVLHPVYSALNSGVITLTVTTKYANCTGSDDMNVQVVPTNFISVTPSDTSICPGDSVHLTITGTQVSQVWYPNIYINDTSSTNPYVHPYTNMSYTVYARDNQYCLDTQKVTITINPKAVLRLPDTATIFPGESFQMDPGGNCLYFTWFPPVGLSNNKIANPIANPNVNTRYFVTGRTEAGCAISDSIDLFVSLESVLDMPNAFSPGSDPNALFKASIRGIAQLKSFKIFNRWGVKVFETSNIQEGWNGQYGGQPQPLGVYVYVVEAVTNTGRVFYKQGNVTLIR